MGFRHVGKADLNLQTSDDPPTSASQSAGIAGVSPCARPALCSVFPLTISEIFLASFWQFVPDLGMVFFAFTMFDVCQPSWVCGSTAFIDFDKA